MRGTRIALILLLYLGLAAAWVYGAYWLLPPTTPDQFKEFGVLVGIGLATLGAFFSMLIALFIANAQMHAARDLQGIQTKAATDLQEIQTKAATDLQGIQTKAARDLQEIQTKAARDLEEKKEEIVSRIEGLKGEITRQNEFLNRTLDTKSNAYNELFVASSHCYRQLQNLAKGQYDKKKAHECEQVMHKAEGLAANLDNEDREIVKNIVQIIMNINDEVENLRLPNDELKRAYEAVWQKYAVAFGQAIVKLQNRSPFHNKSIQP